MEMAKVFVFVFFFSFYKYFTYWYHLMGIRFEESQAEKNSEIILVILFL